MRDQRARCSGCGTHPEDWAEDKYAFMGWHERCPGCEVLAQERGNVDERDRQSVRVFLLPGDEVKRRMEEQT